MDDVLRMPLPEGLAGRRASAVRLEQLWQAKRQACPATHAHEIGVGLEVKALSRFLGWDRVSVEDFSRCAMFHDVGKIHTPREILWKAGRLNDAEMAVMKRHASDGAGMLSRFDGVIGEIGAQMANFHHERPDGLGYHGVKGGDTPVFARICAVADVYEAMTSTHRSYKIGFSPGETMIMMIRSTDPGKLGRDQFDATTLHAFVRMKLGAIRGQLRAAEVDALRDFERQNGVSRKADLAAFKIGLATFERDVRQSGVIDDRFAARLWSAAERDPEMSALLRASSAGPIVLRCADEARRLQDRARVSDAGTAGGHSLVA